MQVAEQNLYINFTINIVNSFDEFVSNVDKHGEMLSDAALITRLKLIGKKLQTIFNKWDNNSALVKKTPHCGILQMDTTEVQNKFEEPIEVVDYTKNGNNSDDEMDDFSALMARRVGDSIRSKKKDSFNTEVSSTSVKSEDSLTDSASANFSRKESEMIRKFKLENVKEEWIRNNKDFYVQEYSSGSWKCFPCKLDNLSTANIISHVSGRPHFKNIRREPSESRLNPDCKYDSDLSSLLSDIQPEFIKNLNGINIIQRLSGFYCKVCSSVVNSEESLKLHISGGKHRKNCESS